eukprot:gene43333-5443_t
MAGEGGGPGAVVGIPSQGGAQGGAQGGLPLLLLAAAERGAAAPPLDAVAALAVASARGHRADAERATEPLDAGRDGADPTAPTDPAAVVPVPPSALDIDKGLVRCRGHGYGFCLRSGSCDVEDLAAPTFAAVVRGEEVWVDVSAASK